MLEQLVTRLKESMREVRSDLKRILELVAKTREDVVEMRGALSRIPTAPQFWEMIVSTWIAAGIVLLAFRFVEP